MKLRSNDSPITVPTERGALWGAEWKAFSLGTSLFQALQVEGANTDLLCLVFRGLVVCCLHGHCCHSALASSPYQGPQGLPVLCFTSPQRGLWGQIRAWRAVDSHGDKCSQTGWSWV